MSAMYGSRTSRRPGVGALLALLLLAPALVTAQSELPTGFGGIDIGSPWSSVEEQHDFELLDGRSAPFDEYAHECGYRTALLVTDKGELLVTANDFVVTELSYIAAIQPDSDLLAVADLVMQNYGQPDRASMRNPFGRVTIDREQVSFISLEYSQPRPVEFTVSGQGIWQYRIRVVHEQLRWHQNKMLRCARGMEKSARQAAAAASAEPAAEPTAPEAAGQ